MTKQEANRIATELVNQMTVDEKIVQLYYRAPPIERLGIKEYVYWNEALHGVARAGNATIFPQAIGLAASFSPELVKQVGSTIAREARAKYNAFQKQHDYGIYKGLTLWSPNINIFRDPRWGRGQETYGEDPYLTGRLGVSFIQGLQGDGEYLATAACAKHFAVHSGPEATRHEFDVYPSKKDLSETYLPAFKEAVQEGKVEAVMGAYNSVDGTPMTVNTELLQKVLRDEWGFEGHVVSDVGALTDIYRNHKYVDSEADAMAAAIKAGCDVCADEAYPGIRVAYDEGKLSEEDLNRSLVRIFSTRAMLGMFSGDCEFDDLGIDEVESKENLQLALDATYESFVLLKNENDFLPLSKNQIKGVMVTGPNATNVETLNGNYHGTASRYMTFLNGMQDYFGENVFYAEGSFLYNASGLSEIDLNAKISEAIIQANRNNVDVIIACLGLDPSIEGEAGDASNPFGAGDKNTLDLPKNQLYLLERLLEIGKPVILVLSSGGSNTFGGLEKNENLKAIIQTWYPGAQGGKALAKVIFGDAVPSGKLPITFYNSLDDLPEFEDYSMKNRTYKFYQGDVLFPFGYGLTYGELTITDSHVKKWNPNKNRLDLEIDVTNSGKRKVSDVVQVYLTSDAPEAEFKYKLVGIQRVDLDAGESRQMDISLDTQAFEVVEETGNVNIGGSKYTLYVGTSQPDDRSCELLNKQSIAVHVVR